MKYGNIMLFAIILAGLLVIGAASAADISGDDFESTDDSSNVIGGEANADFASQDTNNLLTADDISDGTDLDQTSPASNFNKSNSECCSFVIQKENETVFGFRQDAPLNGFGVVVHNDSLDGVDVLIQEIDTKNRYFIFKMQEYHNFCKLWMNCNIGCTVFFNGLK